MERALIWTLEIRSIANPGKVEIACGCGWGRGLRMESVEMFSGKSLFNSGIAPV